jgi:hypothetical protein
MRQNHVDPGNLVQKMVDGLEGFQALSGIIMAHRFIHMEEDRDSCTGKGFRQRYHTPHILGVDPSPIKSQFSDSLRPPGKATRQFPLRLAQGMEGGANEGKDPVREFPGAIQEVVISLLAEPRVLPGKTAYHAPVHILPVHVSQEVLDAGHAGLWIPVKKPETLVQGAKSASFLPDFVGEEMGMGIDDHRVGSNPPEALSIFWVGRAIKMANVECGMEKRSRSFRIR